MADSITQDLHQVGFVHLLLGEIWLVVIFSQTSVYLIIQEFDPYCVLGMKIDIDQFKVYL